LDVFRGLFMSEPSRNISQYCDNVNNFFLAVDPRDGSWGAPIEPWFAGWRGLLPFGVCDVPKGQVCAARPVQWIHAEHGHVMQAVNTASLTTANPQANSRGRA